MQLVTKIIVVALALFVAEQVVEGISIIGFGTAVLVAVALGLINILVRPVLLILTLPITIVTFGLFSFVLNALLFWLIAALIPGFTVDSFIAALLGSLIVSVVNFVSDRILP